MWRPCPHTSEARGGKTLPNLRVSLSVSLGSVNCPGHLLSFAACFQGVIHTFVWFIEKISSCFSDWSNRFLYQLLWDPALILAARNELGAVYRFPVNHAILSTESFQGAGDLVNSPVCSGPLVLQHYIFISLHFRGRKTKYYTIRCCKVLTESKRHACKTYHLYVFGICYWKMINNEAELLLPSGSWISSHYQHALERLIPLISQPLAKCRLKTKRHELHFF